MAPTSSAEMIDAFGCRVEFRRVVGPEAQEIFLSGQPPGDLTDAGAQAEAIYRAVSQVLSTYGGSFASVVSETVFLRDSAANFESVRAARESVLAESNVAPRRRATSEIEQPPLNSGACLEVALQAVIPLDGMLRTEFLSVDSECACAACAEAHGLRVHVGEETRVYAGGLCGGGKDAYTQTLGMFRAAESVLQRAGMEFSDVVRTWIYLREMERDYDGLNRGRRVFFAERGIDPVPASTGIGGGPISAAHDLCLGIYAVKSRHPSLLTVMTSPTLNEAGTYGADFVRGMKSVESNKIALHVSGTASINEVGETAHIGDFEAQADRMLVNIRALLEKQGASFAEVVSGVTYVKHASHAARLQEKFRAAGFEGFPNVLVEVPVCRPELLCEVEVLAVLPRAPAEA